ncbi:16S rRNA (cytidine(1402)-2'-O)-methyltransferase [Saccharospirillum salsuginis]|uniref:Ribosomal RNA small subunit methyltransferase I n=1 Tax=Saccharospirillum salsuginis TaxID=418750 RepID=A0A918K5Q4_9GAMM|nr:16S rRNA (cytidine(1402)-2'-O)-methyltransferase [Saccharospirillum salsuginis]GGX46619.1 ribosomal RNA small subunit methyltransferase I [Saccharospirillum salsuginis]
MTDSVTLHPALYVVATPIGHLDDISMRATRVLQGVNVCCAEDTRHSKRLLDHLNARPKLVSLHEHNERDRTGFILSLLRDDQSVALISDAGTPLISDPGYHLVKAVAEAGYTVHPIPGPSAVITALSVSGLPTDRWVFEGFLPAKTGARQKRLQTLARDTRTLVFYESSHRILDSLNDMKTVFGSERPITLARELTKTFETVLRGTLEEVVAQVESDSNQQKGEFVLVVGGTTDEPEDFGLDPRKLAETLGPLMPPKQAAAAMVELIGGRKKQWYELITGLDKGTP